MGLRTQLVTSTVVLALVGCRGSHPSGPPDDTRPGVTPSQPPSAVAAAPTGTARFRARILLEGGRFEDAARAYEALRAGGDTEPRTYVGQALSYHFLRRPDDVLAVTAAARAAGIARADLAYVEGHARRQKGDLPGAQTAFEQAVNGIDSAPEANYWLAVTREERGDFAGATAAFATLAAQDGHTLTLHPLAALYRWGTLQIRQGQTEPGQATLKRYEERFKALKRPALTPEVLFQGRLSAVDTPPPAPAAGPAASAPPEPTFEFTPLGPREPASALAVGALDGKRETVVLLRSGKALSLSPGESARVLGNVADATAQPTVVDLDEDGRADVLLAGAEGVSVLRQTPAATFEAASLDAAATRAARPLDPDHDGDLDLYLTGAPGVPAGLLQAAGGEDVPLAKRLVRATDRPELSKTPPHSGAALVDADDDGAIDLLLFGGAGGPTLLHNTFAGPWAEVTAAAGLATTPGPIDAVAAEDLDGDGLPDLGMLIAGRVVWQRNVGHGRFDPPSDIGTGMSSLVVGDFNNDGRLDLATAAPSGGGAFIYVGRGGGVFTQKPVPFSAPLTALVAGDLDGDGRTDLVALTAEGPVVAQNRTPGGDRGLDVHLSGLASNRDGVGTAVEVLAGSSYVRRRATGARVHFGLGAAERADVVRLRWPTGSYQVFQDVPAGLLEAKEPPGLTGSCPFLYGWDGEKFHFFGDFLGQAPIGIPLGRDGLVTPDFDEPYLLRGEDLKPKDGLIILQMKEEFREVTYLDAVHLSAIDRPAEAYTCADGRCKGPPFPQRELYGSTRVRPPRAAHDQDGNDVLPRLLERDDKAVRGFEGTELGGLATSHAVEIDVGPLAPGDKPILYLEGWVYWAGSNTEAALTQETAPDSARHTAIPTLEVPDGPPGADGKTQWRTVIADLGWPAGSTTRGIPIPLAGLIRPDDPRVRISTNLLVAWDRALIGLDGGDDARSTTELPLVAADLHFRGVATAVRTGATDDGPELWDYATLTPSRALRWGQIPGLHTADGDVRDLLATPDDRVVTLDAGDEVTVMFDPRDLPAPAPGTVRDYLLRSWGWDKDSSFHTQAGQAVGPLPFQKMRQYPFGPEAASPGESGSRLTRPARPSLPDLRDAALGAGGR